MRIRVYKRACSRILDYSVRRSRVPRQGDRVQQHTLDKSAWISSGPSISTSTRFRIFWGCSVRCSCSGRQRPWQKTLAERAAKPNSLGRIGSQRVRQAPLRSDRGMPGASAKGALMQGAAGKELKALHGHLEVEGARLQQLPRLQHPLLKHPPVA